MSRVLFLTCHLAGSGHLVRTLALARAVTAAGGEARVVSGGRALPHLAARGVDLVEVPPLMVRDLDFSTLLTPVGQPADAAYLAARLVAIREAIGAFRPDALVTELFPLGRRRLAAEFEVAIEAARAPKPLAAIVASVRDVPEPPSRPERVAEAAARLRRFYDLLLVHGDERFLPLSESWPLPPDLGPMTLHAGYVGDPSGGATPARRGDEVLVSVGGGDRGRRLLSLAAAASRLSDRRWRLLVGGADAETVAAALRGGDAGTNLTVEPARPDYRALLARAACSVSLCGYNTAMDLAPLGTPAILVPDEAGGEREQAIRAQALARFPGFELLREAETTPQALAAAVARLAGQSRPPLPLALGGAARAAAAILETTRRRQAS